MRTAERIVRHGVVIALGIVIAAVVSYFVGIEWPRAGFPVFAGLVIFWLAVAVRVITSGKDPTQGDDSD